MPKLLIVDDEPANIELLARRLARRGFEVVSATSAEEGIARAVAEKPDVILMDIKMPVVDGFEATRRLKAGPETRAIPVIALTAHAMQEDRDRVLAAGADEYEAKPVDLDRLLAKIQGLTSPPQRGDRQ
jgi:CheY-like chemotaxis protein